MKELNDIIVAYDKAILEGKQTALATVVHVVGSSYRRPGARMLVTDRGEITGAISGGCLEGDALRKALLAINEQQNKLVIYDTTDEDDLKFGVQLGCNGIVYILFEPINANDRNPIDLLRKVVHHRKECVLVTVFNRTRSERQEGTCYYISHDEAIPVENSLKDLEAAGHQVLDKRGPVIKDWKNGSALFQFVSPAIQLVIVGAGNDAQPLAQMASLVGWNVMIADGRATHATKKRFPSASQVIVAKAGEILRQVEPDHETAFVLMTHNYNYDTAVFEQLLKLNCGYIGILGPAKKLNRMMEDMAKKGIIPGEQEAGRIFGPVGLDIGAETSEEIAVSIIAEIKSVLAGTTGISLKEKKDTIHSRLLTS